MTAQDDLRPPPLNPQQFYHGSSRQFAPGDTLDAAHSKGREGGGHVYLTRDREYAAKSGSNVYTVEPTGHVEPDPKSGHYRTHEDVNVVGAG